MATKTVPRTVLEVSIRSQVEDGGAKSVPLEPSGVLEEEREVLKSEEAVLSEMYSSSSVEIR